jgi:hypothetical protein
MARDVTAAAGVSVHLSVNLLSACDAGEQVLVSTRVLKIGRTLGFCDFEIRRLNSARGGSDESVDSDESAVVARGSHVKHLPMGRAWDALTSRLVAPAALRLYEYLYTSTSSSGAGDYLRKALRTVAEGVVRGGLNRGEGRGGRVNSLGHGDAEEAR